MMNKENKKYWLSPDQLHDTKEYRRNLRDRYHEENGETSGGFSRRSFLGIMGASLALAGLAGCRRPVEKIVPYVVMPEEVIPGVPQYYASTMPLGTSAYGILVESHEGRPTKIEGNPKHPSTLGSADIFLEAAILGLYDPDRSKKVMHAGAESTYNDFVSFWREQGLKFAANRGEGLAVISESFSSPTLMRLRKDFLKKYPNAPWICYEPVSDEKHYQAVSQLTARLLRPVYHYNKADVILSLDADFLLTENENIKAARGFAAKRKPDDDKTGMNRLYAAESAFSITGSMADHRLRISSAHIGRLALAIAEALRKRGLNIPGSAEYDGSDFNKEWIEALADDLYSAKGRSLIVAGSRQPIWVHKQVIILNDALGNIGQTVTYRNTDDALLPDMGVLKTVTERLKSGAISTIIIFGGNPVYNAPADSDFASVLSKCENSVHFSEYMDETSKLTKWHIPRAHFLESWGDARAVDGTLSVIQPMIEPLYDAPVDSEIYALLATGRDQRGYDIIRETWQSYLKGGDFEKRWRKVLHDGLLADSALPDEIIKLSAAAIEPPKPEKELSKDNLELNFYPSKIYDGRFANNGWLQELPDPINKLTWGNAALLSTKTAAELELANGDMVNIETDSAKLEIPVWISPGQANYTVAVALGYGRNGIGKVADGVGANTYTLRNSNNSSFYRGVKLVKTGAVIEMAGTQDHGSMHGRPIVREAVLDEYRGHPEFAAEMVEHPPLDSIYPEHDYGHGYQWGMVIDLNACIGCSACTIACQSENNIPIVGKLQVSKGREMHWIRNDRYFVGDEDDPQIVHMPVACQQCENAPCESVCPVAATVHDKEGLNNMTYNRCIGTRYCSNNCPYKVRRFNFFNYTGKYSETIKMAQNPDVTVRSRGVMEKCTFCTQRINRAKIRAKQEGRTVRDGEIMTACEQACPTKAIRFGNINDPDSAVTAMKKIDRNYALLGELNVRPRNSYLAKIRNPNPKLEKIEDHETG
ncbi:MAG: molybdopterin oxidoreductase [candidate division Zixibacteria bacterium HGW-Zixibacteria-1]|nr:MAG: molybdopterin oxidoreductase [candidate division Zixibacteria bacterium HGW-Zixibacteria-1]